MWKQSPVLSNQLTRNPLTEPLESSPLDRLTAACGVGRMEEGSRGAGPTALSASPDDNVGQPGVCLPKRRRLSLLTETLTFVERRT